MRILPLIFLLVVTSATIGCVRYVDSRKDLVSEYGFDPATNRVGIEGFYRYEQEQKKRLELLIQERELATALSTSNDYKIGPGDEIKLSIKNFDEVSKVYTVSTSGTIRLPFIGTVEVQDLSEDEAAQMISKLVTEYVVSPMVDVELTKYASNVVWVLDNSSRTGNFYETKLQNAFPIKRQGYSLIDLLIELQNTSYFDSGIIYLYPGAAGNAQGNLSLTPIEKEAQDLAARFTKFSPNNWSPPVEIKDCDGSEYIKDGINYRAKACFPYENKVTTDEIVAKYDPRSRIEIDVEELFGAATQKPLRIPLMPGDLVYIPQPPTIQIYGEVRNRGTFMAGNGQSTGAYGNQIKPSLLSLIAAANGLTYAADINDVQVYREIQFGNKAILSLNLEKVILLAGQDLKLKDGDIVFIPSAHGRFYEEHTINAINNLTGSIQNVDGLREVGQ